MARTAVTPNSLAKLGLVVNSNNDFMNNYLTDVPQIKSLGFSRIRLGFHYTDDTPTHTKIRAAAALARSLGIYVTVRFYANLDNTFASTDWTAYSAAIISEATLWQTNGWADQIDIGNEMENSTDGSLTATQIYNNFVTLAASVKAVYSGYVSYAFSSTNPGVWNTNAAALVANSNFDFLGANIYGGWNAQGTFNSLLTTHTTNFGAKAYLSEFNLAVTWSTVPVDQDLQAAELSKRLVTVLATGIPAYFYNWRSPNDAGVVKLSTSDYTLLLGSLLGGRRFLTV